MNKSMEKQGIIWKFTKLSQKKNAFSPETNFIYSGPVSIKYARNAMNLLVDLPNLQRRATNWNIG